MDKYAFLCRMYLTIPKAPGVFGNDRSDQFSKWLADAFAITQILGYQGMLGDMNRVYLPFRKRNPDGLSKFSFGKEDIQNFRKIARAIENQLVGCTTEKKWRAFSKQHEWALECL